MVFLRHRSSPSLRLEEVRLQLIVRPPSPTLVAPRIVLSGTTARVLASVDARGTTQADAARERERTAELRVWCRREDCASSVAR